MNPWAAAILGYVLGMAVGAYIWHQSFLDGFLESFYGRVEQHHVADAFWLSWNLNGEPHKHGYYEATWMAIRAALEAAREKGE